MGESCWELSLYWRVKCVNVLAGQDHQSSFVFMMWTNTEHPDLQHLYGGAEEIQEEMKGGCLTPNCSVSPVPPEQGAQSLWTGIAMLQQTFYWQAHLPQDHLPYHAATLKLPLFSSRREQKASW